MKNSDYDIKNVYLGFKGGVLDFKGNSMEPFLREGDKIKMEPVFSYSVRPGDVVVFKRDRILACHRIVAKFKRYDKFYFWERGDNKGHIGIISEDEIIGRVRHILRDGVLQKTGIFVSRENIFFHLLNAFIYPYVVFSGFIKKKLFLNKKNFISHFFGTIVWRIYNFFFNIIDRKAYVHNRGK